MEIEAIWEEDPMWKELRTFLSHRKVRRIYFSPSVREKLPPDFTPNDYSAPTMLVIHKGDLSSIELPILTQLLTSKYAPVFANAVFIVFKRVNLFDRIKKFFTSSSFLPEQTKHVSSLWNAMRLDALLSKRSPTSRSIPKAVYVGNNLVLTTYRQRYKMYVKGDDLSVAPHIILDGVWESWNFSILEKLISKGDTVIDIGAHFGDYTLPFADWVGDNGRVISIEANPTLADIIKMNVIINGFAPRVTVYNYAVWDTNDATLALRIPGQFTGSATLTKSPDLTEIYQIGSPQKIEVKTITLQRIINKERPSRIKLIKIDAEGAEYRILKNSINKLPASTLLMFEFNPYFEDIKLLYILLWNRNYTLFKINHDTSLTIITKQNSEYHEVFDVLAIPRKEMKKVSKHLNIR